MNDILECNDISFYRRYGRSLTEMWMRVKNTELADAGILTYYDALYADSAESDDGMPAKDHSNTLLGFICGFGDGRYPEKIIDGYGDRGRIIIYEPDDVSFLYACTQRDVSRIISDTRVEIVVYDDEHPDRITEVFDEAIQLFNAEYVSYNISGAYMELYGEIFMALKERIRFKAEALLRTAVTAIDVSEEPCKNELYAFSILKQNSRIESLMERLHDHNIPVIIVGAGPSLDRNMDKLNMAKGKAIIIAVSHAMKTLTRGGIQPDIVATMDPISDKSFLVDKDKYYILAHAQAARFDAENNNGKCIFYGFDRDQFPFDFLRDQKDIQRGGGSVSTDVMDLFSGYGFCNFILVGQDLAFDEMGNTHAGNEIQSEGSRALMVLVDGVNGKPVMSRPDWIQFNKYIENCLANNPMLNVIDATEGGALIKGTSIMTLEDAINRFCNKPYPIKELLTGLPKALSGEEYENMRQIMIAYARNLKECESLIRTAIDMNHSIVKCMQSKIFGNEYNKLCRKYDELYQTIMNSQAGGLLAYYAQDIVQEYLRNAVICEQSKDILRKMNIEENMFTRLLPKIQPLKEYILELFDDLEGDAIR